MDNKPIKPEKICGGPKKVKTPLRSIPKGTEVIIIARAILVDGIEVPARSDGHRATIKYKSDETKSGYRQVQVPIDFVLEAESVEGREIGRKAPTVYRAEDSE